MIGGWGDWGKGAVKMNVMVMSRRRGVEDELVPLRMQMTRAGVGRLSASESISPFHFPRFISTHFGKSSPFCDTKGDQRLLEMFGKALSHSISWV